MKKILLFALSLNLYLFANSQQFQITAQFKDAKTLENIPLVYLKIFNKSDSLLISYVADEKGFLQLNLPQGYYKFIVNQIGYQSDTLKITVEQNKFLGTIKLTPIDTQIEEITVSAKSHKNLIDKDIQIITKDKKEGAANTYDVLDRIQGLSYDRYNQKIKVDNSDNIIILVNGIEKNADYIKNLNPDRLLRVEIIRSPSGKYAIEGYQAIINIILKDNYRGFEANNNSNIMIDYSSHSPAPVPIIFEYISLEQTNKNLNLYINYSANFFDFKVKSDKIRKYTNGNIETYETIDNTRNLRMSSFINSTAMGVDWNINPRNIISTELNFSFVPLKFNDMSSIYLLKPTNIKIFSQQKSPYKNYEAVFYYIYNHSNKFNITTSLNLSMFDNNTYNLLRINDVEENQNSSSNKKTSNFNVEMNYILSDKLSLNFGNQEILNILNSTNTTINNDQIYFLYRDTRIRNYLYLLFKATEKISIKLGTASEIAILNNANFQKTFPIWMPHFDFNYKPIDLLDFTIKYRSNSKYPTIDQINPYVKSEDINTISTGNPSLKPSNEHKLSLRMNILQGLLALEPFYYLTNNYIIQTIKKNDNGLYVFSFENAGRYLFNGLNINLTIPFAKFLVLQNDCRLYKQAIEFEGQRRDLKHWTMSSNLLYINNKYSTVAGVFFQKQLFRNLSWTGYNSYGNDFWAFFVQQPFFNKKINVMILGFLPIDLWTNFNQDIYVQNVYYTENNNIYIDILKNLFLFQISYRFSKGKEIQKIEKRKDEKPELNTKKLF